MSKEFIGSRFDNMKPSHFASSAEVGWINQQAGREGGRERERKRERERERERGGGGGGS